MSITIKGKEYTEAELEEIIKRHDLMYNFFKAEHERVNGGDSQ